MAAGVTPIGEDSPSAAPTDARVRFMAAVTAAIRDRRLKRLVLSKPKLRVLAEGFETEGPVLKRIRIQPVRMKHGVKLGFDWQYDTRDQRSNLDEAQALETVDRLLGEVMTVAVLETAARITELGYSKRGRALMRTRRVPTASALPAETARLPSGQVTIGDSAGENPAEQVRGASQDPRAAIDGSVESDAASSDGTDDWAMVGAHNRGRHYLIRIDRPWLVDLGVTPRVRHL